MNFSDKNNEDNLKSNNKTNPWFFATLFLCITILILTAIVFYVIKSTPSEIAMKGFLKNGVKLEHTHTICVEEDMTLEQIAEESGLSFKQLCKTLGIDENTDPKTKLSDLFDEYEDN